MPLSLARLHAGGDGAVARDDRRHGTKHRSRHRPVAGVLPSHRLEFKPDGGLKDMMAWVTMLAVRKDGLISLPPPKWRQNRLRTDNNRSGHLEPPLIPAADNAWRGAPARPAKSGAGAHPFILSYGTQCVAPPSLSRLQDPGRCPDAATPSTTAFAGPFVMIGLHHRTACSSSSAGQLHQMDVRNCVEKNLPLVDDNPDAPSSTLDSEIPNLVAGISSPSSAAACPRTWPRVTWSLAGCSIETFVDHIAIHRRRWL